MKRIPLTKGKVALIDDDDFERVSRWCWHASRSGAKWHAARTGSPGAIYMHRFVLGLPHGGHIEVDHINGDGLDNRRCNLRLATHAQNSRNTAKRPGTTSRYKGVCWHRRAQKWMAQITVDNRGQYLGLFVSETEAALVYDRAARYLFGEFARTNFGLAVGE